MRRGAAINFKASGMTVDFTSEVSGFDVVVQNALVCLGNDKGSDAVFPDKGTELMQRAAAGGLLSNLQMEHETNLAGLNVLHFSRNNDGGTKTGEDRLAGIKIQTIPGSSTIGSRKLRLVLQMTSTEGKVVGREATL